MAFLMTTGALIILNQNYENIFKLDFSPARSRKATLPVSMTGNSPINMAGNEKLDIKILEAQLKQKILDSLDGESKKTVQNTTSQKEAQLPDNTKSGNKQAAVQNNDKKSQGASEQKKEVKTAETPKDDSRARQDSSYAKWKKEMVKIYESMDSKTAAKIIQKLNDNQARDILFSMKKKKAAQIIAELSPDTANRLTRIQ